LEADAVNRRRSSRDQGSRAAGAFRVIYVATFADVVYVLHAFQKKTRQTAKRDVDLAASRLREQVAGMR
jgi:phage-related protein